MNACHLLYTDIVIKKQQINYFLLCKAILHTGICMYYTYEDIVINNQ